MTFPSESTSLTSGKRHGQIRLSGTIPIMRSLSITKIGNSISEASYNPASLPPLGLLVALPISKLETETNPFKEWRTPWWLYNLYYFYWLETTVPSYLWDPILICAITSGLWRCSPFSWGSLLHNAHWRSGSNRCFNQTFPNTGRSQIRYPSQPNRHSW